MSQPRLPVTLFRYHGRAVILAVVLFSVMTFLGSGSFTATSVRNPQELVERLEFPAAWQKIAFLSTHIAVPLLLLLSVESFQQYMALRQHWWGAWVA
jgi:hypothetical protein